ncbi:MAG: hypothetical protein ACYS7Y_36245, partial [Planctomycetota bacterium]
IRAFSFSFVSVVFVAHLECTFSRSRLPPGKRTVSVFYFAILTGPAAASSAISAIFSERPTFRRTRVSAADRCERRFADSWAFPRFVFAAGPSDFAARSMRTENAAPPGRLAERIRCGASGPCGNDPGHGNGPAFPGNLKTPQAGILGRMDRSTPDLAGLAGLAGLADLADRVRVLGLRRGNGGVEFPGGLSVHCPQGVTHCPAKSLKGP